MDNRLLFAVAGIILFKDKLFESDDDLFRGIKNINIDEEKIESGIEILSKSKKYLRGEDKKFVSTVESILDVAKGVQKLNNISYQNDDSELFRGMDGKDKMNLMLKEIVEVLPGDKKEVISKFMDMKNKVMLVGEFMKNESMEKTSSKKKENIGSPKNSKALKAITNFMSIDKESEEGDEDII